MKDIQVPSEIALAAANAGFRRVMQVQQGIHPVKNSLYWIAIAIGLVVVSWLIAWVAYTTNVRAWGVLALTTFIVALWSVVNSLLSLFRGKRSAWLYDDGVVWRKNSRIETVAWSEVKELWLWKAGGYLRGVLLGYCLVPFDGRKLMIDSPNGTGEDPFGVSLEGAVRKLGRPVVDNGPYVGRMRP